MLIFLKIMCHASLWMERRKILKLCNFETWNMELQTYPDSETIFLYCLIGYQNIYFIIITNNKKII